MKTFLTRQKYIGGIFLFFFLISANCLSYSTHFIDEFGHDARIFASHSCESDAAISTNIAAADHQHDGDRGTHHEDGNSCCDSHSHISIPCQQISCSHSPRLVTHLTGEPFKYIPEVYLDKFIPPQNPV